MAKNNIEEFSIDGARICFRNFSGKASKYNREGDRNFMLLLDPDVAASLAAEGWAIKQLKSRDPEDEPQPAMSIKVKYGAIAPKIYLISGKKKTLLDEDSVGNLDYAEIKNIDITVRPYCWEVNGKTGVAAYVKTMYVVIAEDKFASKYENYGDELEEFPFT